MVVEEFKFCKIAKFFKPHCGPDRKQERNGVDLSKMTVTDEIKNEFAGIFFGSSKMNNGQRQIYAKLISRILIV